MRMSFSMFSLLARHSNGLMFSSVIFVDVHPVLMYLITVAIGASLFDSRRIEFWLIDEFFSMNVPTLCFRQIRLR